MDQYEPVQLSTFALTLFRKTSVIDGESVDIGASLPNAWVCP